MKQLTSKNRKLLKNKMAEAFSDNIKPLSSERQEILLDDLVTALENRLEVLSHAQLNLHCFANVGVKVPNATIKAWNVRRHPPSISFQRTTKTNAHNVQIKRQLQSSKNPTRLPPKMRLDRRKNAQKRKNSLRHYTKRHVNTESNHRNKTSIPCWRKRIQTNTLSLLKLFFIISSYGTRIIIQKIYLFPSYFYESCSQICYFTCVTIK